MYKANQALYDAIQDCGAGGRAASRSARTCCCISGCQDNQTSADGKRNGLFTQTLLGVWDGGGYKGGYKRFYNEIVEQDAAVAEPNWLTVGASSAGFSRRKPFTI